MQEKQSLILIAILCFALFLNIFSLIKYNHEYDKMLYSTPNKVITEMMVETTAYNIGDISQCAGDPCITASGVDGCELLRQGVGVCASNYFDFGTILEVPNYGECVVVDKMNSRFSHRLDIAFPLNDPQAKEWGVQELIIKF